MNTKQNSRAMWIVMALVGSSLALIALAGQVARAQPQTPELRPPFKFAQQPVTVQAQTPPPGSTVLMTETFGATFTATTNLQGATPLWRVTVNSDDTARYYWGRVGSAGQFINSAWSAARPITTATALNPGTSTYPRGQDSWLIYGPIDLSRFKYAHLSFEYYLDSLTGDTLLWAYSTDGQTFYGNSQGGPLRQWISNTLSFDTNTTFQTVYLAFAFNSHTSPQGIGPFVRNVRLTGEPLKLVYVPSVMNNYTPPPLFGPYTFDVGNTDINHWGGPFYNTGTTKYGQCVTGQCAISPSHPNSPRGNPGNSLRLYTNGTYSFVATSPNDTAPDSFDLYVDISPWVIYPKGACSPFGCPDNDLGDWYGIIFNASNNGTFGATPKDFIYLSQYYRLYFYNLDSVRPVAIALDKCSGNPDYSCQRLQSSSLPGNFIGNASGFDTVHIQRLASGSIKVWLNGNSNPVISVSNQDYTTGKGFGKYGVLIFSWTRNDETNPPTGQEMQIDFDNIKVYQR